ncbi:MAG TPA: hypothetical protein PK794_08960, partial [Armatimonadota bacterium]|nr:hypothetical protein [Armatimonadota bacterium]
MVINNLSDDVSLPDVLPAELDERAQRLPSSLPVLPLRDMVVFPSTVQSLCVGRDRSRLALEAAERDLEAALGQ